MARFNVTDRVTVQRCNGNESGVVERLDGPLVYVRLDSSGRVFGFLPRALSLEVDPVFTVAADMKPSAPVRKQRAPHWADGVPRRVRRQVNE